MSIENEQLFLFSYNHKEGPHRLKLLDILKNKEEASEYRNVELKEVQDEMVIWFRQYVNSLDFLSRYNHPRNLVLIAEALFWMVKFDLEINFKNLSFEDLKAFKPSNHINLKILSKLTMPDYPLEISYAICNAALAIYVKDNGFEKFKQEEIDYKAKSNNSL